MEMNASVAMLLNSDSLVAQPASALLDIMTMESINYALDAHTLVVIVLLSLLIAQTALPLDF